MAPFCLEIMIDTAEKEIAQRRDDDENTVQAVIFLLLKKI